MLNVLESIPYNDQTMGRRQLVSEKHLLLLQIALKPGQVVPTHNANSNVHLLVLEGSIDVTLNDAPYQAGSGSLLAVALGTSMQIRNTQAHNATFLVIKTPNPSEIKTAQLK